MLVGDPDVDGWNEIVGYELGTFEGRDEGKVLPVGNEVVLGDEVCISEGGDEGYPLLDGDELFLTGLRVGIALG